MVAAVLLAGVPPADVATEAAVRGVVRAAGRPRWRPRACARRCRCRCRAAPPSPLAPPLAAWLGAAGRLGSLLLSSLLSRSLLSALALFSRSRSLLSSLLSALLASLFSRSLLSALCSRSLAVCPVVVRAAQVSVRAACWRAAHGSGHRGVREGSARHGARHRRSARPAPRATRAMGAPTDRDPAPPPLDAPPPDAPPQGIARADCAAWTAATLDADPATPAARLWAAIRRAAYGTAHGRTASARRRLTRRRRQPLPFEVGRVGGWGGAKHRPDTTVACSPCTDAVSGLTIAARAYYVCEERRIVLCCNELASRAALETALAHELHHAYEVRRSPHGLAWGRDPLTRARGSPWLKPKRVGSTPWTGTARGRWTRSRAPRSARRCSPTAPPRPSRAAACAGSRAPPPRCAPQTAPSVAGGFRRRSRGPRARPAPPPAACPEPLLQGRGQGGGAARLPAVLGCGTGVSAAVALPSRGYCTRKCSVAAAAVSALSPRIGGRGQAVASAPAQQRRRYGRGAGRPCLGRRRRGRRTPAPRTTGWLSSAPSLATGGWSRTTARGPSSPAH